jgi:tetratricopeptide (TPR) repeat protein
MGLAVLLKDRDEGRWIPDVETGISRRLPPRSNHSEVEMCARCHSRRSVLTEDYVHGQSLMDTHLPSLLVDPLYFADGQILDEVYVYGSFLQSKMYKAGVTCTDCHYAHRTGLFASPDDVCARCHLSDKYAQREHHFHKPDSTGASCVECHMPARSYMVVDPRNDHSFRVPRPDLSLKLGVTDACSRCHSDKSVEWSAEAYAKWYGTPKPHFGEALHAGMVGLPGARDSLTSMIDNKEQPAIVRATAVQLLGQYLSPRHLNTLQRALGDESPVVREAAASLLDVLDPGTRAELAQPLLTDPVRAVRIQAARILSGPPETMLDPSGRLALESAVDEYREAQRVNADTPEGRLNLGAFHVQIGEMSKAEEEYKAGIRLEPFHFAAYVNLADLYRSQGRDAEGEAVLRSGLEVSPESPGLHHALGLALARLERSDEALEELERAAELAPDVSRYSFVYGVALNSAGESRRAVEYLDGAYSRHPADVEILYALVTICRDLGLLEEATRYADLMAQQTPDDPRVKDLQRQLDSAGH